MDMLTFIVWLSAIGAALVAISNFIDAKTELKVDHSTVKHLSKLRADIVRDQNKYEKKAKDMADKIEELERRIQTLEEKQKQEAAPSWAWRWETNPIGCNAKE